MRFCTLTFAIVGLLLMGVFPFGIASPVHAQSSRAVRSSDHVHTYARSGHATHTVYVWGAVDQPGVWKIEPSTGLVEFFSVVSPRGYGVEGAGTKKEVTLRIHRSSDGDPQLVREIQLNDLLELPRSQRPALQAGDVLEVRTKEERKFSFETVTGVLGTVSSLVLLGLRIFDR